MKSTHRFETAQADPDRRSRKTAHLVKLEIGVWQPFGGEPILLTTQRCFLTETHALTHLCFYFSRIVGNRETAADVEPAMRDLAAACSGPGPDGVTSLSAEAGVEEKQRIGDKSEEGKRDIVFRMGL